MLSRPTPSWLPSAVFYEIYPQSFLDTNADGIGDLPGVIQKLDYIRSLGVDAIWLNPCFVSPFGDAGYDVADFYNVDPRYGANADLKRVFREAHKRGMKVCLDLVAGHTSDQHPWFQASAKPEKNKYTNWYVWTDSVWREPGKPLNGINGYSARDGNYVTNFFHFQPALNYGFANPDPQKPWQLPVDHPDVLAVRDEMKKIMRYWLDLGADGFRVDMAASLVKNDSDLKETMAFWRDIRAMYDREYPEAALIAEWSEPAKALAAGFHIDFMIHFGTEAYTRLLRHERERDCFGIAPKFGHSFFDQSGKGDINAFLDIYREHYGATKKLGYISLPTGNHDIARLASNRSVADLKVIYAFLLTMPGVPYIYMGDEIGMSHVEGLVSKEGGYGRTGARTPMQWDRSKNAGFSKGAANKLYIPLDPRKDRPTVAAQEADGNSLLNHVRRLIALRRAVPALSGEGDFEPLYAKSGKVPFVYLRSVGGQRVVIAINPSAESATARFTIPGAAVGTVEPLSVHGAELKVGPKIATVTMSGVSWGVFRI